MIRLLDSKDVDSYRDLLLQTVNDNAFSMSTQTITQMKADEVNRQIQTSSQHICTGYFDHGKLIGFCHCSFNSETNCGVIWGMYIHFALRLKGFGAALIGATLDLSRSHFDLTRFELTTEESNAAAIRLYAKLGFSYQKRSEKLVNYELVVETPSR